MKHLNEYIEDNKYYVESSYIQEGKIVEWIKGKLSKLFDRIKSYAKDMNDEFSYSNIDMKFATSCNITSEDTIDEFMNALKSNNDMMDFYETNFPNMMNILLKNQKLLQSPNNKPEYSIITVTNTVAGSKRYKDIVGTDYVTALFIVDSNGMTPSFIHKYKHIPYFEFLDNNSLTIGLKSKILFEFIKKYCKGFSGITTGFRKSIKEHSENFIAPLANCRFELPENLKVPDEITQNSLSKLHNILVLTVPTK